MLHGGNTMLCQLNRSRTEKSGMEKLATLSLITAGLAATAYFGYQLFEKMRGSCKKDDACRCGCEDEPVAHEYDHYSENDSLCHDKKDYYHTCGCFDTDDGNPPICDDTDAEETI